MKNGEIFYYVYECTETGEIIDTTYIYDWDVLCDYILTNKFKRATTRSTDGGFICLPEILTREEMETRFNENQKIFACEDEFKLKEFFEKDGNPIKPRFYEIVWDKFSDNYFKQVINSIKNENID